MAQDDGFKHISVTAADEDDIVIVAGIKDDAGSKPETLSVPAPEVEPEPEPESEPAPKPKAAAQVQVQPNPGRKDAYHETTLEDLEHAPMPFAQRVVIIAAIICIIGAVIYCVAFMG